MIITNGEAIPYGSLSLLSINGPLENFLKETPLSLEIFTNGSNASRLIDFPKDKLKSTKFHTGVPKASNHNTGYKGRTAIHEIMEINATIRNLIYKNADQNELFKQAKENGMTTLRDAGIGKIMSGET